MALGTADAAEAARHPGHRRLRGPLVPHQPLGLRLHRRRHDGRHDRPRRQAGGDHRHRRHGDPVRAARRPVRRAPVRLPAHAVVGRLARQQADRSRVVDVAASRAGSARAARTSAAIVAGQPVEVDLVDDGWTDIFRNVVSIAEGREPAEDAGGARPGRRARRLQEDEHDPPARRARPSADAARPRVAQAVVPPDVQAADVQRRVPRVLQPRQRHARRRQRVPRASSASRRRASSPTARSTRSTASSTRRASRSRATFRRRLGIEINGRDGLSLFDHWARRAAGRCTASRPAASRTGSTSACRRTPSAST